MVNSQDEKAGNSVSELNWSGFDQLELSDDANSVNVTIGSSDKWDKAHLRRLRQSADLPGLVPVIDSDFASDGKPFAVTPVVDSPTLANRIPPSGSEWQDCAAITEAAARATHEAHLRGLFHGALSPDQIHVIDGDVAVNGIGLGLGGTPSADYSHWVAPEVLDGNEATERSDVYSLGKILEASLGSSLEDVPRSVRRLIMWSSSDTPEARPPSALEFASILAEALGDDRTTYSPAFIPTADTNDLASTASEAVAGFVAPARSDDQSDSSSGAAGLGVAAVGAAGVAAAASSLLGGDDDTEGDDGDVDAEASADDDLDGDEDEDADDGDAEAEGDVDADGDLDDDDVVDEAVTTGELPDDAVESAAAATTEISEEELADIDGDADEPVFDSRQYGEEIDADDDPEYEVPAAAQTIDIDEPFEQERKGNKAGILVGAILAAGLGVVAFQLLNADDNETDTAGPTTEETTATTATTVATTQTTVEVTPTVTEAPPTSETTVASTTATTAAAPDDTADDATTSSTEAPPTTEAPDVAPPAATVDGPISAEDAGVQVLHGIPGVDVDVYVNGEALAPGFSAGTIAGPANLDPGSYDVDIYAASDAAPASAADRSDDPLISETMTVGADPATLVAHLDGSGVPTLSAFAENFESLDPATGRIDLRHLAAAPAVQASVDGVDVAGLLEPGKNTTLALAAGEHTIVTKTADGTEVKSATINLADGELANISVIGSAADGTIDVVLQRYTGLSSAPVAVPTGNSNLLAEGEDPTGLYLLAGLTSLMALAGGLVMMRRNRRVL